MNIIEIKDLTFSYPGAKYATLKNVNLTVEKGDFLAIIGNNGCGKSTLCKTLNGIIPHFIVGDMAGEVTVCGLNTKDEEIGVLSQKAGYVYQDFENQIIRPTVLDDASYACLNYAMKDHRTRGLRALEKCGLVGRENDFIWQLSGGQTHLLALAGALSLDPEILILDEPIAQLDPAHADKIYEVLKDLNENHGKTIIVIEHHTEYIAQYCKNVVFMKDGTPQWKLPSREALCRVEELEQADIFPPQVTVAAHEIQKSQETLRNKKLPVTIEEGMRFFEGFRYLPNDFIRKKSNINSTKSMISFKNVSLSYRTVKGEPKQVFKDLSVDINDGEKVAVIGSNGAGKSTFMKLMTGLIKPADGEIYLDGRRINGDSPERLSETISLVYQNPEDMFIKDSIENDISYAMRVRDTPDCKSRTDELLKAFRLDTLKDRDGRLLSGGQMRRASLAVGIALKPPILLLDEPTANLDIATRHEIMRTLSELKGVTDTVLIATHDMQLVCQWAERILVLCGGRIIADGERDEIFSNRRVCEIAGIRPPDIFTLGRIIDPSARCYTTDEFERSFRRETVCV